MTDHNQRTYAAAGIVRHYAALSELQPAEQTVLNLLRDRLPAMQMLDIGVGGGRTTQHFAQFTAGYVGIDSSAEMIAACQQRFANRPECEPKCGLEWKFECGDARAMAQFADNSFDFILFSFNGLDYVSHADRLRIFQEVSRVGKPGGYFCFSSHNLAAMERQLAWRNQLSLNPVTTYSNLVMLLILRGLNRSVILSQLKAADYAIIRDESHNFRLQTYYVRPQAQLQHLATDFQDIQLYSWKTGLALADSNVASADLWLYYLCVIR